MTRRSRTGSKGPLWHGYRRPVWRDKVFWLAVGTSIAALFVQNAFGNFEATTRGWIILGLEVVVTFGIAFALIGVLAGTVRGFGEGWRQADAAASRRGTERPQTAPPTSRPSPAVEPTRAAAPAPAAPADAPEPEPVEPEAVAPVEPEPVAPVEPEPATVAAPAGSEEDGSPDEPTDRPKTGVEIERQARRLGRAIAAGRRTYKKYDES